MITSAASNTVNFRIIFLFFIVVVLLFGGVSGFRLRQGDFAAGVSGEERGKLRPVKVYRLYHLHDLRVFFLDFLRFKVFQLLLLFKDFALVFSISLSIRSSFVFAIVIYSFPNCSFHE